MSEVKKISEDHLSELRDLIKKQNTLKIEVSDLSTHIHQLKSRKQHCIESVLILDSDLVNLQNRLSGEYEGLQSVDIETGEYK